MRAKIRSSAGRLAQAAAALGLALGAVAAMPAAAEDAPSVPESNKTESATPASKEAAIEEGKESKASNPCAVKKKKKKKGPCAVGG